MLRISVANPYEYPLEFQKLKDAARAVFEGEGVKACKVTLAFVDNAHIHRLNNQFLKHDEPTDVLTFPYTEPGAKSLSPSFPRLHSKFTKASSSLNNSPVFLMHL